VGAAWAGTIAFFVTMINRLYFATALLPNVSKTILRTILCSVVAIAAGFALGTLSILRLENVASRFLAGGSVIAVVVPGVMLLLSSQLRVELLRLFSAFYARIRVRDGI
jgi:hypothetical protein